MDGIAHAHPLALAAIYAAGVAVALAVARRRPTTRSLACAAVLLPAATSFSLWGCQGHALLAALLAGALGAAVGKSMSDGTLA